MAKKEKICLTCNTKYSYCPNCNKKDPTWMSEFHDENCKNIFDIATRFNMQLLTKEEAKEAMEKCDLSNKENFKDYLKRDLKNIFAEKTSKPAAKPAKAHEVVNKTEE